MSRPQRKKPTARLLYGDSISNSDMLYFGRFHCPDPFLAFQIGRRKIAVASDLEIARMRRESTFTDVLSWSELSKEARKRYKLPNGGGLADIVKLVAAKNRIRSLEVPRGFPLGLAEDLRERKLNITTGPSPFFPQRVTKTDDELREIRRANAATAAGHQAVVEILRASHIQRGYVMHGGKRLTSEFLRAAIARACLAAGAVTVLESIAAAGDQGCDCHCNGSGPIRAHELIVVDIFPRLQSSGYFGDMTRTYLKGKASEAQRKLVADVKEAHRRSMATVKAGTSLAKVHLAASEYFEEQGYESGEVDGQYTGFFHSLGHGVGLNVHEAPSVSHKSKGRLRSGMVITIEPGLYYPGLGGCRWEDVVAVTRTGCSLLSKFPYEWEIP